MPTNLYRFSLLASGLLIAFLGTLSTAHARRASKDRDSTTTVVIDAGHGGYDRGGIPGQRVAEKEMTLDVAQRLKKVLADNGYRVVMTRDSDVFVPLGTRVAIANSYANSIFVSVHFNSAKRSGASGIETYFYDRESLPLASAIHYFVAGGAPSSNRNVRRRGYYVLRKNRNPAVRKALLTVKSSQKKLQLASAAAAPSRARARQREWRRVKAFRCNRTSIKPELRNQRAAGPSVHTKRAHGGRKAHRNQASQRQKKRLQKVRRDD